MFFGLGSALYQAVSSNFIQPCVQKSGSMQFKGPLDFSGDFADSAVDYSGQFMLQAAIRLVVFAASEIGDARIVPVDFGSVVPKHNSAAIMRAARETDNNKFRVIQSRKVTG